MQSSDETSIFKNFRIKCFVFIFLAVVLPVLAWLGFFNNYGDSMEAWFQRSGALMVLAAIASEFYVSKMRSCLSPSGWVGVHPLEEKYSTLVNTLNFISISLAILGTLVCGYGDLIYA